MSKTMKNSLMIITIMVISFIIIWFGYDIVKTEPADANVENTNLVDENTGLDNIINELFENVAINNTEENEVGNAEAEKEEQEEDEEKDISTSESFTSKQEKAIALVKEVWGEDAGVYFWDEKSIDSQGRYIVSVRDKRTTNSLAFFVVDVDKELVTKK